MTNSINILDDLIKKAWTEVHFHQIETADGPMQFVDYAQFKDLLNAMTDAARHIQEEWRLKNDMIEVADATIRKSLKICDIRKDSVAHAFLKLMDSKYRGSLLDIALDIWRNEFNELEYQIGQQLELMRGAKS